MLAWMTKYNMLSFINFITKFYFRAIFNIEFNKIMLLICLDGNIFIIDDFKINFIKLDFIADLFFIVKFIADKF